MQFCDTLRLALAAHKLRTGLMVLGYAGFRLEREIAVSGNFSILEAVSS